MLVVAGDFDAGELRELLTAAARPTREQVRQTAAAAGDLILDAVRQEFLRRFYGKSRDEYVVKFSEKGSANVAILTDLGSWHESLVEYVATCDLIVLEANHDEEMLRRGPDFVVAVMIALDAFWYSAL